METCLKISYDFENGSVTYINIFTYKILVIKIFSSVGLINFLKFLILLDCKVFLNFFLNNIFPVTSGINMND